MLSHVSMLGLGESPSDDPGRYQATPEAGITVTPIVDRSSGLNGAVYVGAMGKIFSHWREP